MDSLLRMGGGNVEDDWPELEPDRRNDRADDPDTDPNVTDDKETGPASRPATLSLAPDTVSISVSCRSGHVRSCSFFYRLQASY